LKDALYLENGLLIGWLAHRSGRVSRTPTPLPPTPTPLPPPRWSNGWTWYGEPFSAAVHLGNDEVRVGRTCYPAIRHALGDVVRVRDCLLLRSGPRPKDLPFVAKVCGSAALRLSGFRVDLF